MALGGETQQREVLGPPISVQLRESERVMVRRAAFLCNESVSSFTRTAATKAAARVIAREERKAA